MLIFLDESGDAGFKFDSGSSSHFVIALIIFDDPLDAEETASRIKKLRQELKVHEMFEFKFNKMNDFRRYRFLEAVRDSKFRIRAMVVDKRNRTYARAIFREGFLSCCLR
jgi:CO dehydrogenase nickel-insertion accessory protein CooC1